MSTTELTKTLDALPAETDYTDPQTYSKLLGYDEEAAAQPATTEAAPEGETAAAPAAAPAPEPAPAPAPAAESSAPPAAAETKVEDDKDAQGVATKDGKRVIPYAVLEGARTQARTASARVQELTQTVEALQQQLTDAKAGKSDPSKAQPVEFTDAELAELEADMPAVAKLVKAHKELQAQIAAQPPAPAPTPAAPAVDPAQQTVQELIDNRPLLARWQAKGGAIWAEALRMDNELKADPVWAARSLADRFAEVERLVAGDLGIPLSQQTTPPAPAPAAAAPSPAPATPVAAPAAMPTLTDLSGGAVAAVPNPLGGMATGQMVDKAMSMSLEELNKLAGLHY